MTMEAGGGGGRGRGICDAGGRWGGGGRGGRGGFTRAGESLARTLARVNPRWRSRRPPHQRPTASQIPRPRPPPQRPPASQIPRPRPPPPPEHTRPTDCTDAAVEGPYSESGGQG